MRSDFARYWNQITPENEGKWGSVQPSQGVFNWGPLDAIYKYANDNGLVFKEHTFVWGAQQPPWVNNGNGRDAVRAWMKAFCERYPKTKIIDVVNEPPPHTTPKYKDGIGGDGASGYDWIVNAFKWAREFCPNATLLLNDYNNIELSGDTSHTIDIVKRIKAAGAPIDGVGCQAHGTLGASTESLKQNIDRIASETGLPVYITEFDLDTSNDSQQKTKLEQHFTMFWNNPNIKGITLWGYVLGATWIPNSGLIHDDGTFRPAMTWLVDFLKRTASSSGATSSGATSSGATSSGGTSSGGTSSGGDAVRSAGCGKTSTLRTASGLTLDVGGTARTYNLRLPDAYDSNHPYRLIVAYHWLGGTANDVTGGSWAAKPWYGLWDLAGGSTIFVAPQGTGNGWFNGNGSDVEFSRQLIARLESELCIDTSRIFAEGFSMGGSMSYAMACAMPDKIRGVAVHSGGPMSGCVSHDRPVAYFMTHGIHDGVCTYPGYGVPQLGDFARLDGCTTTTSSLPTPTDGSGRTPACLDFAGCSAGHPVRACLFVGDHTPSPPDSATSWVPAETWRFISQF